MSMRFTLLLLLSTLLLNGCAIFSNQSAPRVALINLLPKELGLFEQQYQLELRVQNPSPNPLLISGMAFDLELNGRRFAQGVSNQSLNVPAFGSEKLTVQVSSSLFSLLAQLRKLSKKELRQLNYALSGQLYSPNGLFSRSFETRDQIDLQNLL